MELEGIAELNHWAAFPSGYWVKLEPTTKARHFYIRVTDKQKTSRVKARRHPKRLDKRRKPNA